MKNLINKVIEDKPVIVNNSTHDNFIGITSCVILYHGMEWTFDNDYRFSFYDDAEFLQQVQGELDERIKNELKYHSV